MTKFIELNELYLRSYYKDDNPSISEMNDIENHQQYNEFKTYVIKQVSDTMNGTVINALMKSFLNCHFYKFTKEKQKYYYDTVTSDIMYQATIEYLSDIFNLDTLSIYCYLSKNDFDNWDSDVCCLTDSEPRNEISDIVIKIIDNFGG
jgi:hypothetical protein